MKKLFYVLVLFAFLIFGMSFYVNNPQPVVLKYYLGFEKELPLAVLLLITLIIGVFVGYFASILKSLKLRRNLARANRAVKNLESEHAVG